MKKALVAFLTGTLLLCGCGSKTESTSNGSQDDNKEVIEFNPAYVAIDNEYLTMEVTSISKEVDNAGEDSESTEYNVNLKITNKSDKYNVDAVIWDGDGAVGSYTVSFAYSNTDTRPGKINDSAAFSATASKDPNRYNSEGSEHITCLEDLLDFDSVVSIEVYEDTGSSHVIKEKYSVDVSLKDAQH